MKTMGITLTVFRGTAHAGGHAGRATWNEKPILPKRPFKGKQHRRAGRIRSQEQRQPSPHSDFSWLPKLRASLLPVVRASCVRHQVAEAPVPELADCSARRDRVRKGPALQSLAGPEQPPAFVGPPTCSPADA